MVYNRSAMLKRDDDYNDQIRVLKLYAEELMRTFSNPRAVSNRTIDIAQKELFSGIGSYLTREFLGKSRIGAKIGRAYAEDNFRDKKMQISLNERNQTLLLVKSLRQVLDSMNQRWEDRFVKSVLRDLNELEFGTHKSITILRGLLKDISRIEMYKERSKSSTISSSNLEILKRLETVLRQYIIRKLGELTPDWWNELIPNQIRLRAERRKASRERVWPWLLDKEYVLVEYLSFPDYKEIILQPDNWERVFKNTFHDSTSLSVKLQELETLRNDIAHSRTITERNAARLTLYAGELIDLIRPRRS